MGKKGSDKIEDRDRDEQVQTPPPGSTAWIQIDLTRGQAVIWTEHDEGLRGWPLADAFPIAGAIAQLRNLARAIFGVHAGKSQARAEELERSIHRGVPLSKRTTSLIRLFQARKIDRERELKEVAERWLNFLDYKALEKEVDK